MRWKFLCRLVTLSLPALFSLFRSKFPSGGICLLLNVFTHHEISQLCTSVNVPSEHQNDSFPSSREGVLPCFLAGIVPEEALPSLPIFLYLMCHFFFQQLISKFSLYLCCGFFIFFFYFGLIMLPESAGLQFLNHICEIFFCPPFSLFLPGVRLFAFGSLGPVTF